MLETGIARSDVQTPAAAPLRDVDPTRRLGCACGLYHPEEDDGWQDNN